MSHYVLKQAIAATALAAVAASAAYADNDKGRAVSGTPAMSSFYPVVREAAEGLPGHTVYRPADMTRFAPNTVPVVLWANGACRRSNLGFMITLTTLANHGFVVIANGAHDAPITNEATTVTPTYMAEALDWVTRNDASKSSQFKNRLDTSKIGVAGQSCGGLEAMVAAADPRIDSLAAVNTGFFSTPTNGYGREQLANIKVPSLIANGGPSDVAYQNSIDNYYLITAPTYLAENTHAGHSGLWFGIRDGQGNVPMAGQGATLLVNWFDFTLNGNATARSYFFGASCGLCTQADWKVQAKNWTN